jgi:hypothetical protein
MADPDVSEVGPEIVREWLERSHLLKFQASDKSAIVKEILRKHM